MKQLKVIHICGSDGPTIGGMETQSLSLAGSLSHQSNVDVAFIGSRTLRQHASNTIRFYEENFSLSRYNPLLTLRLYKTISAYQPDVVHCHGSKASQLTPVLKRLLPSVRWISTVHGLKKKTKFLSANDLVITVSKELSQHIEPIKSVTIPNGIHQYTGKKRSKQELCREYNFDEHLPLLMAAGRLAPVKRYDWLVQSLKNMDANLIIYGSGPELEQLEKIASQNVVLAGYDPDVQGKMFGADALVISSEREGLSLSLVEALHAELTVLSTPTSGAKSVLPKNCLLDPASLKEFSNALSSALTSLPSLKIESKPSFRYAKEHLTIEHATKQTLACYNSLLANQSRIKN